MKIAVLGANSSFGSKLVLKAEEAKISVVNLVSDASNLVGSGPVIIKDFHDLTFNDVKDCHYVVDTLSFLKISQFSSDLLPLWHLLEILKGSNIKLLALGSSSFLYTDKSRTRLVYESECMCDDAPQVSPRLCVNAYNRLKHCSNVSWSVLCPPLLLDSKSYCNSALEFGNDILPMGLDGDSCISESDFVKAVVETLLRNPQAHSCISVRALRN